MTYDYFPRVNFDENCIFERGYRVVDNTLITKKKKKTRGERKKYDERNMKKKFFFRK